MAGESSEISRTIEALPTSLKKVQRAASFLLMDNANCAARFGGISLYLIELARLCDEV